VTRFLKDELAVLGYEVHLNRPYAGGFITEHYGRPGRGLHALQVEVNRALYLNETTFELAPGFDSLKADMARVITRLMKELPEVLAGRAAAE
jgi:N-formylglutamate amidohydrolase